ncbi:MAG TPA: hypothetical protein VK445_02205 [Dissulfurispiraceae bacterium]|nr:hypothetical protein [Dissulfurispiraceae bacterium]
MSKYVEFELEQTCTLRDRNGKCLFTLERAILCLDCHSIHAQTRCPNCLSRNCVRLVELAFDTSGGAEHELHAILKKKTEQ